MICAKYGLRNNGIVWDCLGSKSTSVFVKSINRLFDANQRTYNIVKEGFQVVVGSGEKVRLWYHLKWDSIPLNIYCFPQNICFGKCERWYGSGLWEI